MKNFFGLKKIFASNFLAWKKFLPQISWLEKKILPHKKFFASSCETVLPPKLSEGMLGKWVRFKPQPQHIPNLSKQPQRLPSNSVSNFPYVSQFLGLWKNFWLEKNFSPQIFWLEKNFRLKFLGLKKKFCLEKIFRLKLRDSFTTEIEWWYDGKMS